MTEPCTQAGTIARLEERTEALSGIDERLRMLETNAARQTEILGSLALTMDRLATRLDAESAARQEADKTALTERWQLKARMYALIVGLSLAGGSLGTLGARLLGIG